MLQTKEWTTPESNKKSEQELQIAVAVAAAIGVLFVMQNSPGKSTSFNTLPPTPSISSMQEGSVIVPTPEVVTRPLQAWSRQASALPKCGSASSVAAQYPDNPQAYKISSEALATTAESIARAAQQPSLPGTKASVSHGRVLATVEYGPDGLPRVSMDALTKQGTMLSTGIVSEVCVSDGTGTESVQSVLIAWENGKPIKKIGLARQLLGQIATVAG